MPSSRQIAQIFGVLAIVVASVFYAQAQVTTGSVRGVVTDPNGAVVPAAKVTITKKSNNNTLTAQTSGGGTFEFNNLLSGNDYTVTVEAPNFKTLTLTDVSVNLNQITDLPAQLTLGGVGETVTVTSAGTELVDTTTNNLSKSFSERQVVELAQTSVGGAFGGGVNNLALIAPNVSSSGGVGVGSGGSVGGQRPRNNNFMVDGVDNNDKSVTGPSVYISPEVVQEFSLLQNQFSAEFARSNGGQFITVTKSGTNEFHGTLYGGIRNRYLNALDAREIEEGFVREKGPGNKFMPREDFFRGGVNFSGPLHLPRFGEGGPSIYNGKNKLFFFTSYERLQAGFATIPAGITALTAGSLAIIEATPGTSSTNLGVYRSFVPIAATANAGSIFFCNTRPDLDGLCPGNVLSLGVGTIDLPPQPQFNKQNNFVLNIDYTQSSKTQHRGRYNHTNNVGVGLAGLPIFNEPVPNFQRLFSYTLLHTFTSNLSNETRLAYRRTDASFPVTTSFRFPGLTDTTFPNINLSDLGVNIGPNGNFPQTGIENNYQVVNNLTWLKGDHSFKFGGDFRQIISPQTFTQRARGDYDYSESQFYFYDLRPDFTAQRSVGDVVYYGTQKLMYAFVQDDWRVRPNLTLNMGVNYSYQEPPKGTQLQALNAIASVPGLIDFHAPVAKKKNFGPRVGFAWSPEYGSGLLGSLLGSGGKSSIRAGFSMAYDYIFDNLYILSLPPQAQQTIDATVGGGDPNNAFLYTPNFLASGGIPNVLLPTGTNAADARAATTTFIDDNDVPYSLTWTGSFQRQIGTNWSFEARYLGTRGIHLLTQSRINRSARVSPEDGRPGLPTFLTAPSQAQLDSLTLTLDDVNARSNFLPNWAAAGFTNPASVVGFLSNGNSTYHGASAQVTRRFAQGFQLTAAYTWSHLIDDTTAEVFSTVLSPRRVEDFQNLRRDRADSALDRRHRFVTSFIYEIPWFRNHSNGFVRNVLGGFNFSGTYTAESGQKATVLSGIDSNGNGDAAADRAIRNPNGARGTGSTVTALTNSAGEIVGYLADNPNAEYIRAGTGAESNSARNTLQLPGIDNLDFSVFKTFTWGESRKIQLRADFFNALNRPQYIPGSPNDVQPINTTAVGQVNTITAANLLTTFNQADRVFSSNPRVIQLGLKFSF
jgi:hypothetical protein